MIVAVSTKKNIDLVVSPLNDTGLIDTEAPVTDWSSRPGHARPAIERSDITQCQSPVV